MAFPALALALKVMDGLNVIELSLIYISAAKIKIPATFLMSWIRDLFHDFKPNKVEPMSRPILF
jgi:hypothetical protein